MIILGLTGSIGMGKTTTAGLFAKQGIPVFDADATVHELYQTDKALIKTVAERFPKALVAGKIDRAVLAPLVRKEKDAVAFLEEAVHPKVAKARAAWLEQAKADDRPIVLFDIPLLFETGGEERVDKVIVVTAPPDVQRQRVLSRPGMSEARFEHIISLQMPDAEKRRRADFVINTSKGLEDAAQQVQTILYQIKHQHLTGKSRS